MITMIDELEPCMESIAQKMFSNKAKEVKYTLKFPTGEKYKFHIRKLKSRCMNKQCSNYIEGAKEYCSDSCYKLCEVQL